jgi:hypothetical protein
MSQNAKGRSRSTVGAVPDQLCGRLRDANGNAAIETVRGQDPVYMRIAAALLPSKVEITENPSPFTDEQLDTGDVGLFRTGA